MADQNQNPLLGPVEEDEQFMSSETFMAADTALDWDALVTRGNSNHGKQREMTKWERDSLYVKFDPLIASRKEPGDRASFMFKPPLPPGPLLPQLEETDKCESPTAASTPDIPMPDAESPPEQNSEANSHPLSPNHNANGNGDTADGEALPPGPVLPQVDEADKCVSPIAGSAPKNPVLDDKSTPDRNSRATLQPQSPLNQSSQANSQPPSPAVPNSQVQSQPPSPAVPNSMVRSQPPSPAVQNSQDRSQPPYPAVPNSLVRSQPPYPAVQNSQDRSQPPSPAVPNSLVRSQPPSPAVQNSLVSPQPSSPAIQNIQVSPQPPSPAVQNSQVRSQPHSPADTNSQVRSQPQSPLDTNPQVNSQPQSPANPNAQARSQPQSPLDGNLRHNSQPTSPNPKANELGDAVAKSFSPVPLLPEFDETIKCVSPSAASIPDVPMLDAESPPTPNSRVNSQPQSPNSNADGFGDADSSFNSSNQDFDEINNTVIVLNETPKVSQQQKLAAAILEEKKKQKLEKNKQLSRMQLLLKDNVDDYVKQNERHHKAIEERDATIEERNEAQQELAKAEARFADMLMLYEKVKDVTTKVEQNCVILQKREEFLAATLQKREVQAQANQDMCAEIMEKMQRDFDSRIREKEAENVKFKAKIRMCEMKIAKLEGEITQVDRESESLRTLCEDLMKN